MSELSLVGNWNEDKKGGFKRKLKVFTLDIKIIRSELKVSNSKVFSSEVGIFV